MVFMTRFLGPGMKKRADQKKSAIINFTSYYSENPVYIYPIYSSAKSFEDVFSQTLGYENPDLDILTVKNMPTKSKKHPNGVSAQDTVEGVLNDLGHERISYGHWKHSLFRY
jgi:short-subunit dehydrogenase